MVQIRSNVSSALLICGTMLSLSLAHQVDNSFLDEAFGPFALSDNHEFKDHTHHIHQDSIRLPSPDFLEDLNPEFGPLYTGIVTFSHLPLTECLQFKGEATEKYDIAILGVSTSIQRLTRAMGLT